MRAWPASFAAAGPRSPLTAREEVRLARRIERGDLAAKETLITASLGLVISLARNSERRDLPACRELGIDLWELRRRQRAGLSELGTYRELLALAS